MSEEPRVPAAVEHIVGEVRVVREQLHDLVDRCHSYRRLWEKTVSDLQRRPRLTAPQRTELRRHLRAFARRRDR